MLADIEAHDLVKGGQLYSTDPMALETNNNLMDDVF